MRALLLVYTLLIVSPALHAEEITEVDATVSEICESENSIRQLRAIIANERAAAKISGFINGGNLQTAALRILQFQNLKKNSMANYKAETGKVFKVSQCPKEGE